MTIEQAYGAIDANIAAKGPTVAKARTVAMIDAIVAGITEPLLVHQTMNDMPGLKDRAAASDGSVQQLGVIVRWALQDGVAQGMLIPDIASLYESAWA